jgi:hypothetical protein
LRRDWFGEFGPSVYAVTIAVGLVASAGVLLPTLRLVQRELNERRVDRVLHNSTPVFQQVASEVTEVLDLFEWPVFYVCSWPAGDWIFLSPAAPRLWGRPDAAFGDAAGVDRGDRCRGSGPGRARLGGGRAGGPLRPRVPDRARRGRRRGALESTTAPSRCATRRGAWCGSRASRRT